MTKLINLKILTIESVCQLQWFSQRKEVFLANKKYDIKNRNEQESIRF